MNTIATIAFRLSDGRSAEARLGTDQRWSCAQDRGIADGLNIFFKIDPAATGLPGAQEAHEAAKWLKGTLTFPAKSPGPANADN